MFIFQEHDQKEHTVVSTENESNVIMRVLMAGCFLVCPNDRSHGAMPTCGDICYHAKQLTLCQDGDRRCLFVLSEAWLPVTGEAGAEEGGVALAGGYE